MTSTIIPNSFIAISPDCPIFTAEIPPIKNPRTMPQIEYEMLMNNPYTYSSDDVLYAANAERRGISREAYFATIQPDFRLSPLMKRYGWGLHTNLEGKIAIHPLDSVEYEILASDESIQQFKGNRSVAI